jgi:hypothetical protein
MSEEERIALERFFKAHPGRDRETVTVTFLGILAAIRHIPHEDRADLLRVAAKCFRKEHADD